jgi:hypothetical protein
MIANEPERLADRREHAMLGAVGEHLARRWNLAVPKWTDDASRFLHEPYFTTPIENLKAMLLVESPQAFRRRMIFTEAEPLRRARVCPAPRPPDGATRPTSAKVPGRFMCRPFETAVVFVP